MDFVERIGDRVFYGWIVGLASTLVVVAGTATAPALFSVFVSPVASEFGWSRTLISGAFSFGTVLAAILSPAVGRALDRHGARWVVAGGAMVMAAALASLSQATSVVWFYVAFGLSRAIGPSVMDQGATLAVTKWFVMQRPKAFSLLNLGRGVGGTLLPILAFAAMTTFGWRAGWITLSLLVLGVGALPAVLLLRRQPEDFALAPDGARFTADVSSQSGREGLESSFPFSQARKTSAFWGLTTAMFVRGVCASGIVVHSMPYLLSRGTEPSRAALMISLYAACMAVGGISWGWIAERTRPSHCLATSFLGGVLAVGVLMSIASEAQGFLYAVLMGFSMGGIYTLEGVTWSSYFGREFFGAIYGSALMVQLIGVTLGPLVAGLFFDLSGSYQTVFLLFGLGFGTCATIFFLSRRPVLPDNGTTARNSRDPQLAE